LVVNIISVTFELPGILVESRPLTEYSWELTIRYRYGTGNKSVTHINPKIYLAMECPVELFGMEEENCPKCGSQMPNVDQKMVLETKNIKVLLFYRCPECSTTVEYMTTVDRERAPWVKKIVYHTASLEFVYSEE
jgi:hypothetical protein